MSLSAVELYRVILAPMNTEKTNLMSDRYNRLSFKVASWANKVQIKHAIEHIFEVNVEQVSTMNIQGKTKNFKNRKGKLSDWKKAIVKLSSGQDIKILNFINKQ